jgi:hypothetical protein
MNSERESSKKKGKKVAGYCELVVVDGEVVVMVVVVLVGVMCEPSEILGPYLWYVQHHTGRFNSNFAGSCEL